MTPQERLDAALVLLTTPPPSMRRCWQRGCACLTRSALELGLEAYWPVVAAPTLVGRPMRHQLLALPHFAVIPVAATARGAWYGLSRAMHHHPYELAPTVAELRDWHHDVTGVMEALARR